MNNNWLEIIYAERDEKQKKKEYYTFTPKEVFVGIILLISFLILFIAETIELLQKGI